MSKVTYSQHFYEPRLYELAKESGNIYTKAMVFFNKVRRKKNIWLSNKSVARYIESTVERKFLQSQSFQASYQKLFHNLNSYRKSLKEYKINPGKFTDKPRMPRKRKFFQPIQFKKSAVKVKHGFLELTLAKGNKPVKIKWNEILPVPIFVMIQWNKDKKYWQLNCIIEKEIGKTDLKPGKVMAIDLGLKRIAATFDGNKSITYSGKKIKSLTTGRNKINAKTQSKLSGLKKGSRKYKKVKKANKIVNFKIDNKMKDILHKTSRTIVNEAIENKISKIVIGDCSGIHTGTDCGTRNNQQIQQNPEQKLKKYIVYKFEGMGGIVETVPEKYTSQTCPGCCNKHKPQSRIYKCPTCGFKDDRDVVGAKNIYKVSFGIDIKSKLDVIGVLTIPIGWKYYSNRDCKIAT
jgi:putative transposase